MNDNIMKMMEQYFGKDRLENMLNQWYALSEEQRNTEIKKINTMSKEEQMEYLKKQGVDIDSLAQGNNQTNRFNY